MKQNPILQILVLVAIFIVAFVLEIMPWPVNLEYLRPSWIVLVLTYWILALPNRINIGTSFVIGLLWDIAVGSILGVHALVLSLGAYIVAKNNQQIRYVPLWFQAIIAMLYIMTGKVIVFILELMLHGVNFMPQEFIGAVISGLLWPWIFLLMRQIRRGLGLRKLR